MKQVDFSAANLGVHFKGVDLSTCTFPVDSVHYVVRNQHAVFNKVREIIDKTWVGKERETGLSALDFNYLSIEKTKGRYVSPGQLLQPIEVINLGLYHQWFGSSIGDKLFNLIKTIAQQEAANN